jgi:REP element-mobilizing transposase RayT
MVRWYHAIFTAYGFWLPNDPRGSWSTFVGSWELYRFGAATKTDTRRSVACAPHDITNRRAAKQALKYPPVRLDESQSAAIAAGVEQACEEADISLHALAIGFDHVHAIVGRHSKTAEQIVYHWKARATQQISRANCHPLAAYTNAAGEAPTPWARGCWCVYINDELQLRAAMRYVERHSQKESLPSQHYPFLTPV